MFVRFWEYFTNPDNFKVKDDLSYIKLRDDTLDAISSLPDSNPNKKRLSSKIKEQYPKKPRIVRKYKLKLQQINRRVHRMLNG